MTKHTETILKRPVSVIQVFRNASMYAKGEQNLENGRDWLQWPVKQSGAGYVEKDKLYLPYKTEGYEELTNYPLLFLLDDYSEKEKDRFFEWKSITHKSTQISTTIGLNFLRVKRDSELELYFDGEKYSWYPKRRETYQLCVLRKNIPVEIKINGKSDGHHQRYYMEEQFIFEYLGDFSGFTILPRNHGPATKKVPAKRKLIDLRELLW